MRILIVGPSGAGKSTLARRLGARLGVPVIHLDAHYWRAGWREPAKAEWEAQVDALVARDAWIMDGNYSGTFERRIAAADTVVFLDFPRWRCVAGVYTRWWRTRGTVREDLAPGCPEKLPSAEFLKWIVWDYPRRSRPRLLGLLEHAKHVVVLRSRDDVERYARE
ncbi:MAG: AAA family ATPase [Kofleriaceae bacterium]